MKKHFWDDTRGVVFLDPRYASEARLVVCVDYRPLNFGNLANLLLRKIGSLDEFFVFSWWWKRRLAKIELENKREVLIKLIQVLGEFPPIEIFSTLVVCNEGLYVTLPNRAFLKYHNSEGLVEVIRQTLENE